MWLPWGRGGGGGGGVRGDVVHTVYTRSLIIIVYCTMYVRGLLHTCIQCTSDCSLESACKTDSSHNYTSHVYIV